MEGATKARVLSEAQLMALQILNHRYTEEDLKELRGLLLDFNNKKLQQHLDKTVAEKDYTDDDFEKMLKGHDRKTW